MADFPALVLRDDDELSKSINAESFPSGCQCLATAGHAKQGYGHCRKVNKEQIPPAAATSTLVHVGFAAVRRTHPVCCGSLERVAVSMWAGSDDAFEVVAESRG